MLELLDSPKVYRGYNKNVLTWQTVIDHYDKLITEDGIQLKRLSEMPHKGIVMYDTDAIKDDLKEINDELSELVKDTKYSYMTAHLYTSFSTQSGVSGLHKDPCHIWFWQCIGQSKWTLTHETKSHWTPPSHGGFHIIRGGTKEKFILDPGDVLYLPPNTLHDVVPLSPRVGISYGAEIPNQLQHEAHLNVSNEEMCTPSEEELNAL